MRDAMHARLRADGQVFRRDFPAPGSADLRQRRPTSMRRWIAPFAAATAVVAVAAGASAVVAKRSTAVPANRAVDVFPSAVPPVGRSVKVVIENGPGTADDETTTGTVVTEDVAARQSLVAYRRGGGGCMKWQGPQSASGACGLPPREVTIQGAGAVLDRTGAANGVPAVWGSVPSAATTVIVKATNGRTLRLHAVDGSPYGVNFYLAAFDMSAHPLSSVTAYDAGGRAVGRWLAPTTDPK